MKVKFLKKICSAILATTLLVIPLSSSVSASKLEISLENLANNTIKKSSSTKSNDEPAKANTINYSNNTSTKRTISYFNRYDNIQGFISRAKNSLNISDLELAKFILDYTGVYTKNSISNYPTDKLLNALSYKNISVTDTYYKVTKDGSETITKQELDNKMSVSTFVYDDDDWLSDDGYMGIRTTAMESNRVNGRAYVDVVAEQAWFKMPTFAFTDVLAVNSGATYDNSYTTWGSFGATGYCETCARSAAGEEAAYKNYYITRTKNDTDTNNKIEFIPNSGGASWKFQLSTLTHNAGSIQHLITNYWAETRIGLRIILDAGKSCNVQAGYCHTFIGLGAPSVSVGSGGIGLDFAFAGLKEDYFPEPLTLLN